MLAKCMEFLGVRCQVRVRVRVRAGIRAGVRARARVSKPKPKSAWSSWAYAAAAG